MTKKRKALIIVLAAVFVIMLVCYLAVVRPMLKEDDEVVEPIETVDGEYVGPNNRYLMFEHTERDKIKSIEVHNEYGEYTFYRDSSDAFQLKDYEGIPFSEELFAYLVVSSGYTVAERRVEKDATEGQLEDYGLTEPQAYFILTTTDGVEHRVNIGKKLMSQDGFYCSYEGRSCVYVLSSQLETCVLAPIESYITPLMTAGMTQENYFEVEDFFILHDDEPFIAIENCEDDEKLNPDAMLETKLAYPSGYRTNDTLYLNVLSSLMALTGDETVALVKDEDDYKKYGLEDPYYNVSYKFKDYDFTIFISELQEDGCYYAISSLYNYNLIAKFSEKSLSWISYDLFNWISDDPLLTNIITVKSIKVESPERSVAFDLTHGKNSDGTATLDVETDAGVSMTNSEVYNFREYYKALIAVTLKGEAPLSDEEKKELVSDEKNRMLKISMDKTDGTSTEYAFYRYSTRQALITVNGEGEFYVMADFVEKLINDTEKVLEGLNIDSYGKN